MLCAQRPRSLPASSRANQPNATKTRLTFAPNRTPICSIGCSTSKNGATITIAPKINQMGTLSEHHSWNPQPSPRLIRRCARNERRLREIRSQTTDALNEVEGLIGMALDEARSQSGTEDEALIFVRDRLAEATRSAFHLRSQVEGVLDLVQRLLAERRTAQDAFEAGWEGRYHDLLARLSSMEVGWLQAVLGIETEDDQEGDETPF